MQKIQTKRARHPEEDLRVKGERAPREDERTGLEPEEVRRRKRRGK